MRATIYARVSSDPKAIGRSVSEQEAECRQLCEREGWEVVKVFSDNDRSASRYAKQERPAYKQLRRFVADGGCDVLVTWECSRAQRDLEAYIALRDLCRKKEVLWSYSGRTYDMSRTDDRFTTGLDALLAERESDVTRDRILRNVRANAAKGRPHGRIPFGYARQYDPTSGALIKQVVREDQAAVIREAAKRFLAGEATNAIANDFNGRGIAVAWGDGEWDLTRVRRLITNPTIIGQRTHKGKIVSKADWEPILDEATFYRIAAKINDPSRKFNFEYGYKYLLSGIMTCGICGRFVKVMPQSGGGNTREQRSRYKAYICRKFCVSRKLEWVDGLIEGLIIERLAMPDAAQLFQVETGDDNKLDVIAEKRARLDSFYDSAAKGDLSAVGLARIEAQLLPEIEALEKQIRRYDVPSVVHDLLPNPVKVWKKLLLMQKREVVASLLEIELHKSQFPGGSRKFDPDSIVVRWKTGSPVGPQSAGRKARGPKQAAF